MRAVIYNRILLALGFLGIFVSGILSVAEYFKSNVPCGVSQGCERVAADPSSHMLGIPNAYLGLMAYFALTALAIIREIVGVDGAPLATAIGLPLSGIGLAFSAFLQYISFTKIQAFCPWCFTSALTMAATFVFSVLLWKLLDASPTGTPYKAATGISIGLPLILAVVTLGGLFMVGKGMSRSTDGPDVSKYTSAQLDAAFVGPNAHVKNPDGKLTIVEFGDVVCPVCKRVYPQVEDIVNRSAGNIRFVFHNLPLYQIEEHKDALPGAMLSEICAEKGKFWEFIDGVYSGGQDPNAPMITLDQMLQLASDLGINVEKARKRILDSSESDPAYQKMEADLHLADEFGLHATPTYFVWVEGGKPESAMANSVLDLLKKPEFASYVNGGGPLAPGR